MGGSGNDSQKKCGLTQFLVFAAAICSGTACSLCSKVMMELHSVGMTGEVEKFEKPLFQTFGMFIGMTFGMVMHWAVVCLRIPFPGYKHRGDGAVDGGGRAITPASSADSPKGGSRLPSSQPSYQRIKSERGVEMLESPGYGGSKETDSLMGVDGRKQPNGYDAGEGAAVAVAAVVVVPRMGSPASDSAANVPPAPDDAPTRTPLWMYFFLAIPAVFDLGATALCMMGLRYLDVSIYQMLRGSGIIFVALMKQHVLGDHLHRFQWVGVFWNVVSVVIVGLTAMLASAESGKADVEAGNALLGVVLMMAGAFIQALQFVFEEKVMTMDVPAPPLLLIGMEGVWGTLLCLLVVYPISYCMPGVDHGSYESPWNTWAMFQNSSTIQIAFAVYFFAIFGYNLFAVLVTFMLSSVWHAILDNFRPLTVWGADMFIYYAVTFGAFGEPWTRWSYLQLGGMFVLLFGTAVYNAPNAGSIMLEGPRWAALGMDFSEEYREIEAERMDAELDAKWEEAQRRFQNGKASSFMGERSPMISVHTQALRGLGSPKI